MNKKILFFLSSLRSGGKERRAIELLNFLHSHSDIDFQIVLTEDTIHYKKMFKSSVQIHIIERKIRYDPRLIYKFYQIAKSYNPDIIHTWDNMTTFYSIIASRVLSIPIVNSQIADATGIKNKISIKNILWQINKTNSSLILSNSLAGLKAYNALTLNSAIIHNGVDLERFENLNTVENSKEHFGISTKYTVVMVARMDFHKDYDAFISIADSLAKKRSDITFVAVGDGEDFEFLNNKVLEMDIKNFIFTGRINNVEQLINCCDIGVLLSNNNNHEEGISNSIIEYMSLSKPVIANKTGGTSEIVFDNVNGYLIDNIDIDDICNKIVHLLSNELKCKKMGNEGRLLVENNFNIKKMGEEFLDIYDKI